MRRTKYHYFVVCVQIADVIDGHIYRVDSTSLNSVQLQ